MRYRVVAPNKVISSSDCDGPIYESECFAILSKFDDLSFRHLAHKLQESSFYQTSVSLRRHPIFSQIILMPVA